VQQTRGLNRNFNSMLKAVFKGAATTVIGRALDDPLYRHYVSLLDGGTKHNLPVRYIGQQRLLARHPEAPGQSSPLRAFLSQSQHPSPGSRGVLRRKPMPKSR